MLNKPLFYYAKEFSWRNNAFNFHPRFLNRNHSLHHLPSTFS